MKKIFFIACLSFCTVAYSQTDEKKPVEGQFGFGLNLTGLIKNVGLSTFDDANNNKSVWAKYYISDKNVLRLGLGVFSISNENKTADSVGTSFIETDSTFKRTDLAVSLGYERHFSDLKRLDPYLGAAFSLGFVGRTKIQSETKTTNTVGVSTIQDIINKDGGTNFGLYIVIGFNYFIANKLALGAEYNIGYQVQSLGGDITESIINNPASGGSTSTFNTSEGHRKSAEFSTSSKAAIILSYYF